MISGIHPVHYSSYTCIEDIIACVANYWKRAHVLMFSEVWNFRYDPMEGKLLPFGDRIRTNKGNYGAYTRYHGLSIEHTGEMKYGSLMPLIKDNLADNRPVAIYIDSYWCPWNEAYQKHHFPHYCLIIDLDDEKEIARCLDPYLTGDIQELPYGHIMRGTDHGYTFQAVDPLNEGLDRHAVVSRAARRILEQPPGRENAIDSIRRFARDIGSELDLSFESQRYETARIVPLFKLLSYVGWARVNFSALLDHFAHECEDRQFETWAKQFAEIGNLWLVVQKMMVKECIYSSPRFSRESIRDRLLDIADREEDMADSILRRMA